MKVYKGYVRNRGRPEGSIAECYIAEEGVEYCSEYLSLDDIGAASRRNESSGPLSSPQVHTPNCKELDQAHLFVVENTAEIDPYIK